MMKTLVNVNALLVNASYTPLMQTSPLYMDIPITGRLLVGLSVHLEVPHCTVTRDYSHIDRGTDLPTRVHVHTHSLTHQVLYLAFEPLDLVFQALHGSIKALVLCFCYLQLRLVLHD